MTGAGVDGITVDEARAVATREYATRRSDSGWMLLSTGSDGGLHYRGSRPTRDEAEQWVSEKVDALTAAIVNGERAHSLYRTARGELCLA